MSTLKGMSVCHILPEVIFKPKISFISEDKYIFQVLVNILHPILFLQNHCLVTLRNTKTLQCKKGEEKHLPLYPLLTVPLKDYT